MTVPEIIDGARTLYWTQIDDRHRPTGNCRHFVRGVLLGPVKSLVIAQYPGDTQFYLFYCDEHWNVLTDALGDSLTEVHRRAEFEYEGVSNTWQSTPCV
jgi:hypothetical protein